MSRNQPLMPATNVPVVDKDGNMTTPWRRYFDYQSMLFGGSATPNLVLLSESVGQLFIDTENDRAEIARIEAGEMIFAPMPQQPSYADVMQTARFDCLPEMIFQN